MIDCSLAPEGVSVTKRIVETIQAAFRNMVFLLISWQSNCCG
jgi:hypothetical protein